MFNFIKILFRIYNRFFSPDKVFAKRLRSLIGFTPSNIGIFKLAFYHKSASSEKLYAIQSNERLEYLGDAVLGTIVAEYLFKKYPNKDEGFLTKMRSKIVKRQSLNKIADKMGLDVFLNQYNNTRLSRSMLGNALEALVGAVYIECGYPRTRRYVIQKILRGYLDIHELESFDDNYKSQLLEWCQKNGQTVSYKMLAKYKFEKRDRFKVAVLINGKKLASADDFNKKSAEQTASEKAMQILGLLNEAKEEDNEERSDRRGRGSRRTAKGRDAKSTNERERRGGGRDNKKRSAKDSGRSARAKSDTGKNRERAKANDGTSDWEDLNVDEALGKENKNEKSRGRSSRGRGRSNRSNKNNTSADPKKQPVQEAVGEEKTKSTNSSRGRGRNNDSSKSTADNTRRSERRNERKTPPTNDNKANQQTVDPAEKTAGSTRRSTNDNKSRKPGEESDAKPPASTKPTAEENANATAKTSRFARKDPPPGL